MAAALSAGLALAPCGISDAASWIGGSGSWSNPSNWSPAVVPSSDTDVFITHSDALDRLITFDHDYPQPLGAFILDQTGAGTTTFSMSANTFGTNYQNIEKQEVIGLNGRATFLQSGGINVGHPLNQIRIGEGAGSAGTYNLSGGTLSAAGLFMGNAGAGTFLQTAGVASVGFVVLGSDAGSAGTLNLSGTASFTTGTVHCAALGSGLVNQSGGAFEVSSMQLGGHDGPGTYTLSAGTFSAGQVFLGNGGFPGDLSTGVVNQSGGAASVDQMRIGFGPSTPGTWTISGGSLRITGGFNLGEYGHGTFSMGPGAVVNFGRHLVMGKESTGAGTFLLNGGTFSASTVDIGALGHGTFVQTAGTHIVTQLVLGLDAPSTGVYSLSGGTLITADTYVGGLGVGVFNQNGGAHVVGHALVLGDGLAFGCEYNLSGGTVRAVRMDNAFSTFNQTGGVATFTHGITGFGTVNVSGSGTLSTSRIDQFALNIGTGGFVASTPGGAAPGGINRLRQLSITGDGTWDLSDTELIVDYGPIPLPASIVRGYIAAGYAGGSWTGSGLSSSAAARAASEPGPNTALGYADASDLFSQFPAVWNGTVVNESSILVRYTYAGDANLDGRVNLDDFNALAGNFGGSERLWTQGDFNYDGVVNLNDFNALAANFGLGAAGPEVTSNDWAALVSAVPEPSSSTFALLAMPLLRRRSRTAAR